MKNKSFALLSLLTLMGCQSTILPLRQGQSPIQGQVNTYRKPQQFEDITVKFNNAYKALYKDNEKTARRDPESPDKLFIKLIKKAKISLDLAIFDIEEPSAIAALIQAKARGVKVRVITDTDNMFKRGQILPHIKALQQNGIPVKDDKRSGLMHHKFVIMDGAYVLTGSANLTPYSLYRDNNNSLGIASPQLAANFQIEFNRMFHRSLFGPNPHKVPYPIIRTKSGIIKTYFSPKGGAKQAILQTLDKARSSIKFMTFSVTDKDIQKMLVDKAKAGVKVEGIFDGCMISKYSIYQKLLTKNIPVLIDGNQALLHSKVFIIDDQIVITGSYNFSMSAEVRNNENTLIIQSPKVTSFYKQEYNRLKKASVNNSVPPYDNRTCNSTLEDDEINPR